MFTAFPEFAKINLDDRDEYEKLVHELPPYSDTSFTTLHIWWNLHGELSVSMLNGNVVINYQLPFDQTNSGYGLVGNHDIDASFATILNYLRNHHLPERLVHVPEFVIKKLEHPENFQLQEELDYNEYIFDSRALATLEGASYERIRRGINRFRREHDGKLIKAQPIDITSQKTREQLFETIRAWDAMHPARNDPDNIEHQALRRTLDHASIFDIRALGLYIDGELHAANLYHKTDDQQYFIGHHLKTNHTTPGLFDYMMYQSAQRALQEGVPFINAEMDLGIEGLRTHKMLLRPVDFLRKYSVRLA